MKLCSDSPTYLNFQAGKTLARPERCTKSNLGDCKESQPQKCGFVTPRSVPQRGTVIRRCCWCLRGWIVCEHLITAFVGSNADLQLLQPYKILPAAPDQCEQLLKEMWQSNSVFVWHVSVEQLATTTKSFHLLAFSPCSHLFKMGTIMLSHYAQTLWERFSNHYEKVRCFCEGHL